MQSFSWLIDGVLAGSGLPGRLFLSSVGHTSHPIEKLEIDLRFLWDQGIRAILSLTEQSLDGQTLQAFGFGYRHVPVPDMMAPGMADLEVAIAFVETSLREGKPVLVHCAVGQGRTGTVLACYLVRKGSDPAEAIRQVRARRPGSVETPEQEKLVHDYRGALAGDAGS